MTLNTNHRFAELDGLRGIASLMVFFSHFVGFFYESEFINFMQNSPLRFFWNGDAAVNLFFVLSGFVLAKSMIGKKIGYLSYITKRIFRIYPAYYFSILLSLFLMQFFISSNMFELSNWAQSFWKSNLFLSDIIDHIILIKNFNTRLINPVVWSLSVELKISILIPLIIMLFKKERNIYFNYCVLLMSYILSLAIPFFFFFPQFMLGVLFALNYNKIIIIVSEINKTLFLLICILIIFLFGNRFLFPRIAAYSELISTFLCGFGSFGLLIISINVKWVKDILASKVGVFLGKTSYSFYLLHLPLLIIISSLFYPLSNSMLLCGVLTLIITYFISFYVYKFIELKMIFVGSCFLKSNFILTKFSKFL
jgi:peptidoglycan/LPS O-acetylase OafA/YrhL